MFNMIKGIGMVMIVFLHTMEQFPIRMASGIYFADIIWKIGTIIAMPTFFIISGYGFRKVPMKKCIGKQVKTILVPYWFTSIAAVTLFFFIHFASFHWLPGSIQESVKCFLGFLLGLSTTISVMGYEIYSCGPIWFFLALFWGWCLLNYVCDTVSERKQPLAIGLIAVLAWGLGLFPVQLFCIPQGLAACVFLYIGMIAKKKKLLIQPIPNSVRFAICSSVVLWILMFFLTDKRDSMYAGVWVLGPISMLMDGAMAVGIIKMLLPLNQYLNGIFSKLAEIGMMSFYVFCVHTVEFRAVPWYMIVNYWSEMPKLGMVITFVCRFAAVFLVSKLILTLKLHAPK